MASLKGSDFDRQIRDAKFRLAAFKEKRNGTNSHRTHSDALRVKRDRYFKEFKEFAEDNGLHGKLNDLMNEENLSEFMEQRLEGLAFSTQEDYITGWSALTQGLQQVSVSIELDKEFFSTLMGNYIDNAGSNLPLQVDPSINPMDVISQLPQASQAISLLQLETGYRISEAYTVINDLEHYLNDLRIKSVQGKGGQFVKEKIISLELRLMLLKLKEDQIKLQHQSTHYRHLQVYNMRSHDFRAFYIKELYEAKRNEGNTHLEACLFVSKEVNHFRASVVEEYLAKFS